MNKSISPEMLAGLGAAINSLARPIVALEPVDNFNSSILADPWGSRLGGRLALKAGESHPIDPSTETPLTGLLQINLAAIPATDVLPRTGLLQAFVGDDCFYGCPGFPSKSALSSNGDGGFLLRVLPAGSELVLSQCSHAPDCSPLIGLDGVALKGHAEEMRPSPACTHAVDPIIRDLAGGAGNDAYWGLLEAYDAMEESSSRPGIWLGGWAEYTQGDILHAPEWTDFRSIVGIDTTDHTMWGDMGVACFYARLAEARAGNLSDAIYNWDCY